ncbi:gustatory receptor for sugar taste 43a-like [Schistocerca americana]|uniref:gustatory receptor for sugar taste 43a-like n=1 Tax=Schistocerca americana TaxID=7009 RepID=UPI001F4F3016|nr:gustatory receptor for sugar taste 43a-like [Schistocerca americana]
MGIVCGQLLRSTQPPAGSEAELEEMATRAGQRWAAQLAGAGVQRLQRARMALHRCARLCSLHFGPALLLAVLGDFVVMTCTAYWLIVLTPQADKNAEILVNVYALSTVLCRQLLVCWVCSSAAERSDRASLLLSRLQPLLRPGPAVDILRLPVEKLRVSAMGFYDIDLHIFINTVSAAATYLVILAQFPR